jgi:hypothetical protein
MQKFGDRGVFGCFIDNFFPIGVSYDDVIPPIGVPIAGAKGIGRFVVVTKSAFLIAC